MTEGRLEHWVAPSGDDAIKETKKIISEGCPVFITSTTESVELQFSRRNWILHCDTSEEQTSKIHGFQSKRSKYPASYFSPEEEDMVLLRKAVKFVMQNVRPVLIPYSFTFPTTDSKARGDRLRLEELIKNVANWHMFQRKWFIENGIGKEYIISDARDFEIALSVAQPFLTSTLAGLDKTAIALFDYISKLANGDKVEDIGYKDLKLKKEDGSFMSERWIREKVDALEQAGHVSVNRDEKRHSITLTGKNLQSTSIVIEDDGAHVMNEYAKMGKIIECPYSSRSYVTSTRSSLTIREARKPEFAEEEVTSTETNQSPKPPSKVPDITSKSDDEHFPVGQRCSKCGFSPFFRKSLLKEHEAECNGSFQSVNAR